MIIIDGLSFSYGGKKIFEDLTLELPDGVCCIQGISGRGKTTLLRLIAGLEKADGGKISGVPERVAYMFQEDRLLPWQSAAGNVAAVLPKYWAEEAGGWLAAVELQHEADSLPENLSGGQRRRISLARTLAFGGDLLILDEPFEGLDPDLTARMVELIRSRSSNVLVTAHSAYETGLWGGTGIVL
ncbi:MAG: ABC transporter ATP-binding protein [Clostridia bacterium]|nr:ABC transporter ATP-binding protein [Clostridia bacterium]